MKQKENNGATQKNSRVANKALICCTIIFSAIIIVLLVCTLTLQMESEAQDVLFWVMFAVGILLFVFGAVGLVYEHVTDHKQKGNTNLGDRK